MTATITNSRQMELTIKFGSILVEKERKLNKIINAEEARRSKIYIGNEIEDLRYIINCNCKVGAIQEIYNNTLSNNIRKLLKQYV